MQSSLIRSANAHGDSAKLRLNLSCGACMLLVCVRYASASVALWLAGWATCCASAPKESLPRTLSSTLFSLLSLPGHFFACLSCTSFYLVLVVSLFVCAPPNWQRPMGIKLAPRRLGEGKGAAADGSVIIIKYIPSFSFAQKAISHSVAGPQSHNRRATATVWFDAFRYEYATERAEKGP